jgi:hypothetical protein
LDRIENTVFNYFFEYCVRVCCRGDVFTQPVPRNGPCNQFTI